MGFLIKVHQSFKKQYLPNLGDCFKDINLYGWCKFQEVQFETSLQGKTRQNWSRYIYIEPKFDMVFYVFK